MTRPPEFNEPFQTEYVLLCESQPSLCDSAWPSCLQAPASAVGLGIWKAESSASPKGCMSSSTIRQICIFLCGCLPAGGCEKYGARILLSTVQLEFLYHSFGSAFEHFLNLDLFGNHVIRHHALLFCSPLVDSRCLCRTGQLLRSQQCHSCNVFLSIYCKCILHAIHSEHNN